MYLSFACFKLFWNFSFASDLSFSFIFWISFCKSCKWSSCFKTDDVGIHDFTAPSNASKPTRSKSSLTLSQWIWLRGFRSSKRFFLFSTTVNLCHITISSAYKYIDTIRLICSIWYVNCWENKPCIWTTGLSVPRRFHQARPRQRAMELFYFGYACNMLHLQILSHQQIVQYNLYPNHAVLQNEEQSTVYKLRAAQQNRYQLRQSFLQKSLP